MNSSNTDNSDLHKEDNENETLKKLHCDVSKLITAYENAKPILHYNIRYALNYYDKNNKNEEARSGDSQRLRWLSSYFLPTGGLFAVYLFKKRVKRMFKSVLSTCDLYLLYQYEKGKQKNQESEILVNGICKKIMCKRQELIKGSHQAERITTAFQVVSLIAAVLTFISIGTITQIGHAFSPSSPSQLKGELIVIYFPLTTIGILIFLTVFISKIRWYKRVMDVYEFNEKENTVRKSLIKILRFAESPGTLSLMGNKRRTRDS